MNTIILEKAAIIGEGKQEKHCNESQRLPWQVRTGQQCLAQEDEGQKKDE